MARVLSRRTGPLIKVDSAEGRPKLIPPFDALSRNVGLGDFTCCSRGHNIGGRVIPCDKLKIGGFVSAMVDKKLASYSMQLSRKTDVKVLSEFRHLLSIRGSLLQGLEPDDIDGGVDQGSDDEPERISIVDFLRLYHFEVTEDGKFDVNDQSGGLGLSPLRYAVVHQRGSEVELVKELIALGADVECPAGTGGGLYESVPCCVYAKQRT